jgi:hypothetical protein
MIGGERSVLHAPEGRHPTLKVRSIETSDVKRCIARIDVDLLSSWYRNLSEVCEGKLGYTNTVRLIWPPVREKSGHGRALLDQMHRIELRIRKG